MIALVLLLSSQYQDPCMNDFDDLAFDCVTFAPSIICEPKDKLCGTKSVDACLNVIETFCAPELVCGAKA